MEQNPRLWIAALKQSQQNLESLVGSLDESRLTSQSYASEWSIAQVLSHLGSQAEIFGLWLDTGLSGSELPGGEAFGPIWGKWDAKDPKAQAADSLEYGGNLVERFGKLTDEELAGLRFDLFGLDVDSARLVSMRLTELTLHTWDVAVSLDPEAKLPDHAVDLMVDVVPFMAGRVGKPDGIERKVQITTTGPERSFVLETGEAVEVAEDASAECSAALGLPAEALLRLAAGRLDPDHTPTIAAAGVDLDDLRKIFPGM